VGSAQDACAVCGTPVTASAVAAKPQRFGTDETIRFARTILGRPHIFTIVFLVANLFIFLLMWHSSGMAFEVLMGFPERVLVAYGAKLNSYINVQHQWWRFVTPIFIHVNLPHLLVNMYSLWMVGPYVEKLYGSAKFVVLWVLTGIAGVVASYLTVRPNMQIGPLARFIFKNTDLPSAGASGALFGLVGVLFVFGIKYRHELPEGFKRAFGTGLLPMIMLNLFIGFVGRGFIDNAAHVGGFVAGALLALLIDYRRQSEHPVWAIAWRILEVVSLTLVLICFLEVSRHLQDPIAARETELATVSQNENTPAFIVFAKVINEAQEALELGLAGDASSLDVASTNLRDAPAPDNRADRLRQELEALLGRAKAVGQHQGSNANAKDTVKGQQQLRADFDAWKKEYELWLKAFSASSSTVV